MSTKEEVSELTDEWIKLLEANQSDAALQLYCEQIIPAILPTLHEKFWNTHNQPTKYDGLISLLGFTPDTVALAYQFAKPDTFVILHTAETARLLETVVRYAKVPFSSFYHEPFVEEPSNDIYRALEAALKRFPKDARIAIELTGGKKTMGGALAVAAGVLDIDQLYIDYKEYMPEFRKPKPSSTYIHLVGNPMKLPSDLFGSIELNRAAGFFNIGRYDISQLLFQDVRMSNPRLAEICADLSQFYALWNSFEFNRALTLSTSLFSKALQFSRDVTDHFKADLDQLKDQIDIIKKLADNDRLALVSNFFFTAERYEKNGQNDIAALLYYRTLEEVFDNALKDINAEFDRSHPNYTAFGKNEVDILASFNNFRQKVFKKPSQQENLPSQLAMFDSLCLLHAIDHPIVDKVKAVKIANIANIRNLSIYAHGARPITTQAIGDMRSLAIEVLETYIQIKGEESLDSQRAKYHFIQLIPRKQL